MEEAQSEKEEPTPPPPIAIQSDNFSSDTFSTNVSQWTEKNSSTDKRAEPLTGVWRNAG